MSENPFATLDWDSVPDDPFNVPEGNHICRVSEATYITSKKNGNRFLVITFAVEDGGQRVQEYKGIPEPEEATTPDGQRKLSFIKQRLLSLGIPEDRIASFEPDDVVGVRCVVGVKKNGEYTNVRNVTVVDDDFELEDEIAY